MRGAVLPLPTLPCPLPPNEVPPRPLCHSPAQLPAELLAEAVPLTLPRALRLQQVLLTPPGRLPAALVAVVHAEVQLPLPEALAASLLCRLLLRPEQRLRPAAQLQLLPPVAGMQTAEAPAHRLHLGQARAPEAALLLLAALLHVASPEVQLTWAWVHAGGLTLPSAALRALDRHC